MVVGWVGGVGPGVNGAWVWWVELGLAGWAGLGWVGVAGLGWGGVGVGAGGMGRVDAKCDAIPCDRIRGQGERPGGKVRGRGQDERSG